MESWLEWARGPAFRFAFAFMILGLIRHVAITAWEIGRVMHRAGDRSFPAKAVFKATLNWLFPIGNLRSRLAYSLTSVAFHISIILTPILLAGHLALVQRGIGFRWPAIPNLLADVLTLVAVATSVALILQRALARDTRSLSRFGDYIIPALIALPFASGYLAMHGWINPFPFEVTLFVHVMSANLVMILVPITKLSHAALLPGTQVVSEAAWHWPIDSGSKVAVALGKENEPI
ncbi:MAG: hypothetical protein NTW86_20775 [Candidatus Sumerlaeota bacterium]|nr:hypothetical protein [Candidatus Sumerlaeota bacterium]